MISGRHYRQDRGASTDCAVTQTDYADYSTQPGSGSSHAFSAISSTNNPSNFSGFADWLYSIDVYSVSYGIKFDNKDLKFLSPGEKGKRG